MECFGLILSCVWRMQMQQQHQEALQAEQERHSHDLGQALRQHQEEVQAQQASHSQDLAQAQQQHAGWMSEAQAQALSLSGVLNATEATHSLAVQVLICVSCHCIGGFGG